MPTPLRIHIGHHFFGTGNAGDDWMLAGFLAAVVAASANIEITACAEANLETMRRRFPAIVWAPYTPPERERLVAQSTVWLGLGGTPFQFDSSMWMVTHLEEEMRLVSKHAKPAYMLGIGVEDARAVRAERAKAILGQVRHIWTRDKKATLFLHESGRSAGITTGADLANVYFAQQSWPAPQPNVEAVIFHVEKSHQYHPESVTEFIAARTAPLRWIVQDGRVMNYSERFVFGQLSPSFQAKVQLAAPDYAAASVDDLLQPWHGVGTCLSTRYHGALAAAWSGARVAVYPRSMKVQGLCEQLDCAAQPSLARPGDFAAGLAAATAVRRETLERLADTAAKCCHELLQMVT